MKRTSSRPEVGSGMSTVKIGVLGLQGDYQKHLEALNNVEDVEAIIVRTPAEIDRCDGLIIPGGESTTVGKLMARYGVDDAIKRGIERGMTVFGTCTGMILLAKEIEGSDQQRLGLMDICVRRNAFGRQVDSFEADLCVDGVCDGIRAVFIRAPFITSSADDVRILAVLDTGEVVMARQGLCLAAAFHPELTDDQSIHRYFVDMTREARGNHHKKP